MLSMIRMVLGTAFGRIVIVSVAGLVALKAYGWQQQKKGAASAAAKIDASERKHNTKARAARNSSRSGGGVYDPYTRSD